MSLQLPHSQNLPAAVPDLIVMRPEHGEWQIDQITQRLVGYADLPQGELRGRLLRGVFPEGVPTLVSLCEEVVVRQSPLGGVLFRPRVSGHELLLEVHPWGRDATTHAEKVAFFARPANPQDLQQESPVAGLVGQGAAMREVFRKIARYAQSDASVVITGETGTGKELVAAALHERSMRSGGAYVSLNCAAISETLLESELFGHEKGAFTGALRTHRGRFERADGGTLFLDEIGDMPAVLQAKLLRVLETGTLERVGGEGERRVDVRVLSATHRSLEQDIVAGRFRADLYHRLAVLQIHMPPLRERREDIPLLVTHFVEQFNRRYGQRVQRLTPEAVALLQAYSWPGNVRELRNVLERVFVESYGEVIGARAFQEWVSERQRAAVGLQSLRSMPLAAPWGGGAEGQGRAPVELVEAEVYRPG